MADEPEASLDPLLEAEIERATAPYRGKVSPELFAHYQDRLREALLLHPVGRRLLNRVRPLPDLQKSDDLAKREAPVQKQPSAGLPRKKGGAR